MRLFALFGLVSAFLLSLANALTVDRSIDIHTWPLSAPKSQTYARLNYNLTHATITSHTNPAFPPTDDIIRIGFHTSSGQWCGIATSTSNFAAEKDKKLQLHVSPEGEAYHIGFRASALGTSSKTSNKKDDLSVEILRARPGPTPHLSRPVVLNADGKVVEKEREKSFLEKYWIFIAGFVLLQLVMSASKGE